MMMVMMTITMMMMLQRAEISAEKYWRYGFKAILSSKQLVRYIVLSVEPILAGASATGGVRPSAKSRQTSVSGLDRKARLAECVVARERDLGVNDTQFTCVTHLGHLLREGDVVLG